MVPLALLHHRVEILLGVSSRRVALTTSTWREMSRLAVNIIRSLSLHVALRSCLAHRCCLALSSMSVYLFLIKHFDLLRIDDLLLLLWLLSLRLLRRGRTHQILTVLISVILSHDCIRSK